MGTSILGIMSDTHGNLTEMRRVAAMMLEKFNVDVIIHLGDDATDADELKSLDIEVITVPGVFEERYLDAGVPNRIIRKFEGVPFLLTHTPVRDRHDIEGDIDPTEAVKLGDVNVVLYGHTHLPAVSEKYGAVYINPGHLKLDCNRGDEPTFAIIVLNPPKMDIKFIGLDGKIKNEKRVSL